MSDQPLIYEVTDQTFEQDVIAASHTRPVVVDFCAPWCCSCPTFGPMLARVIRSMHGRAALAKLNVDKNPVISDRHQIRTIPAVKVFVSGEVAGEFVGSALEPELRRQLEALLPKGSDWQIADPR